MIVNKITMAIVDTIGPIEFSEKQDSVIDNVDIIINPKSARQKADRKRHVISFCCSINNPSLLKTIKSPVPNKNLLTTKAKKPIHKSIIKV